jgi:PP-loop superfamily ATP-utilizing enzyme
MTPKEKAKELIDKHYMEGLSDRQAKECALITVESIIDALETYDDRTEQSLKDDGFDYFSCELQNMESDFRYWVKVKNEILKS